MNKPTAATGRVRVLQSFPGPRPHTNPYTALLTSSLADEPEIALRHFSWRAALLGSYDVFHAHWPENRVRASTPVKSAVVQLLYAVLLLKLTATRTAVVRTVHNVERPQGLSRRERLLLRLTERITTLYLTLNPTTPLPPGRPYEVVLHGHYRDWYAGFPQPAAVPGRVSFIGLVRRYKAVDALVRAFRDLDRPEASLVVAGRPSTAELARALGDEASDDPRVQLRLQQHPDDQFVQVVRESQLVVLPYRDMHNSAGVLTALSLDRPVLVPRNEVNERLAAEVGRSWVRMYDGELTAADLDRALADTPVAGRPDLDARDWSRCGPAHLAAYRRAVTLRRTGFRRGGSRRGGSRRGGAG